MRPFLCSLLKCTKCGCIKCPKLIPSEIKQISLPKAFPGILNFKAEQTFLNDLIEYVSKFNKDIIDISEGDLYLFLEADDPASQESLKIVELLYGIDVTTGILTCIECGDVKDIKNGILFIEENV
ncbi:hypothetical protein GINT2_000305 [Glugoides intestinalis]